MYEFLIYFARCMSHHQTALNVIAVTIRRATDRHGHAALGTLTDTLIYVIMHVITHVSTGKQQCRAPVGAHTTTPL